MSQTSFSVFLCDYIPFVCLHAHFPCVDLVQGYARLLTLRQSTHILATLHFVMIVLRATPCHATPQPYLKSPQRQRNVKKTARHLQRCKNFS